MRTAKTSHSSELWCCVNSSHLGLSHSALEEPSLLSSSLADDDVSVHEVVGEEQEGLVEEDDEDHLGAQPDPRRKVRRGQAEVGVAEVGQVDALRTNNVSRKLVHVELKPRVHLLTSVSNQSHRDTQEVLQRD